MRHANGRTLTEGQLACMSLVARNLTSKEIACRLGISPHTVDQRVRRSLRALGVSNRREAARLVEEGHWGRPALAPPDPAPIWPMRTEDRHPFSKLPLPFATAARPTNTMTILQRLLWIVTISGLSMIAAFMYLAGLESLGRLLRH